MIQDTSLMLNEELLPAPHDATATACQTTSGSDRSAALAFPSAIQAMVQPVANVPAYLAARHPCARWEDERPLFMRLPSEVAREVKALLAAFEVVDFYRRQRHSVTQGCVEALRIFRSTWNWTLKRFRARYDLWKLKGDWFVLVNRAKAGAAFQVRKVRLPEVFLQFVAQRFAEFRRSDGKRQAVMSIHRQWLTGRDPHGHQAMIPGYEVGWERRNRGMIPEGWSYDNLCHAIKKRGAFTKAMQAFLHEGESAARQLLPQILGTRKDLRFLEQVTFDDVRMDWLILNEATGAAEELWLLVARDQATGMILGFVMHPATVRPDGTATHLGLAQMKQLAGWMLERYPLPPYVVTWKIERGTATLSEGMRLALGELFGNRIVVSFTSMIGASASPAGYKEKAKGNSRGKASHESHNRLIHTQASYISGQTGNRWDVRPADLNARTKEAVELWQSRQVLPEHLRDCPAGHEYPVLTLNQAREHLFRICADQNDRTDHRLEGFEEKVESIGGKLVKRMEKPIERAARLVKGYEWQPLSPDIIAAFYEHTQRPVIVKANGEIALQHDGRLFIFRNGGVPLTPETEALAYFHEDDPKFLHLTDGKGAFLGTWINRDRVGHRQQDALAEAMRYTHIAREAAREAANVLAAPERAELEAMRQRNHELMKLGQFTDVTVAPDNAQGLVGAPTGAALTAVSKAVKTDSAQAKQQARVEAKRALNDILSPSDSNQPETPNTTAAEELFAALRNDPTEP